MVRAAAPDILASYLPTRPDRVVVALTRSWPCRCSIDPVRVSRVLGRHGAPEGQVMPGTPGAVPTTPLKKSHPHVTTRQLCDRINATSRRLPWRAATNPFPGVGGTAGADVPDET